MKLSEKLKALIPERRRAEFARRAGLSPTTLNGYIHRDSEPLPSAALRLARALDVQLDWLLDDEQDFPVPAVLARASNQQLKEELSARIRPISARISELCEQVRHENWKPIGEKLLDLSPDKKLPEDLAKVAEFCREFEQFKRAFDELALREMFDTNVRLMNTDMKRPAFRAVRLLLSRWTEKRAQVEDDLLLDIAEQDIKDAPSHPWIAEGFELPRPSRQRRKRPR